MSSTLCAALEHTSSCSCSFCCCSAMRMFDIGSQAPCRCCSLRSPLQRRSPRADLAAATFPSRGITTSWCPLTRDIGGSARGGLVRRHVGERYTSTGPPAARWPEPPRPHHRPRQGRRGRWGPHPRLDIRDWSCGGRRSQSLLRWGRRGRWLPAQAPAPRAAAPCPRPKDKGGGGGEAKSPTSGFATIRVDSLTGERPAMTSIGWLVLCLGWIRRLED